MLTNQYIMLVYYKFAKVIMVQLHLDCIQSLISKFY